MFIELTEKSTGKKELINVRAIQSVFDGLDGTNVYMISHPTHSTIYEESYDEVKALIKQAQGE